MNIKKTLNSIKRKFRYLLLTNTEKKMISVSATITENYIKSRKFRRIMDDCGFGVHIKKTLTEWDKKTTNKNQSY